MKRFLFLLLISSILFSFQSSDFSLESKRNFAYQRGEKLKFMVYYNSMLTGNVSAAEVVSEVKNDVVMFSNRPSYHIYLTGRSVGTFNWFFKVRDSFETWVDEDAQVPWYYRNRVQEGDYNASKDIQFWPQVKQAKYINNLNDNSKIIKIPSNVQDLLSALYYARNIDYSGAVLGSKYQINFMLDDSVYQTQLEYLGIFYIKTKLGKVECMKFKPRVLSGSVFKEESPLVVYVSNDLNRLPVFAESEVMVGSVRMELVDYWNLRNPFSALKEPKKKKN